MLQTESVAFASMPTPFPPSLVFQDVEARLLAMEDMADPGHGDADAWQSAMALMSGQQMMAAHAG